MSCSATIVIPTLNGRGRVEHPLAALAAQETSDVEFEVVIVDNGSAEALRVTDEHPALAPLRQKGVACRVVNEERRGLVFARIRGALEARSPLVCFLDDDNVPATPLYVKNASEAFSDPATALLVSRVFPRYEVQPTHAVARREHLLAINYKLGDAVIEWGEQTAFAPTLGAGMWVRREAFLSAIPWQRPEQLLSDRKGKSLASGGDIEFGCILGRAGHKRVYRPELKLWHLIPAARLRPRYFCRLIVGIVRSQLTLETRQRGTVYGAGARARALSRLLLAALAAPYLFLREDGFREAAFVLASRWASVAGPYGGATQKHPSAGNATVNLADG